MEEEASGSGSPSSSEKRKEEALKYSRSNTLVEKRRMRSERKRRKRQKRADQRRKTEACLAAQTTQTIKYKCMARSYWDRWQWELTKRKEAMQEQLRLQAYCKHKNIGSKQSQTIHVHQIDLTQLCDPFIDGKLEEIYLGRGSFSVVRLQLYRGIKVAVKEFLPRTVLSDVENEALILGRFCHPFLPFMFGFCITARPYRIITQFHGFGNETVTLQKELTSQQHRVRNSQEWLRLFSQLLEAVNYLHSDVNVLHNDIKLDNIILSEGDLASNGSLCLSHIVLIDFGKATGVSSGRKYDLSEPEKVEYLVKYPHISPEIVYGESRQSIKSDMYAVGLVLLKISDYQCFSSLSTAMKSKISTLISSCKARSSHKRPSAGICLKTMKELLQ